MDAMHASIRIAHTAARIIATAIDQADLQALQTAKGNLDSAWNGTTVWTPDDRMSLHEADAAVSRILDSAESTSAVRAAKRILGPK